MFQMLHIAFNLSQFAHGIKPMHVCDKFFVNLLIFCEFEFFVNLEFIVGININP